MTTIIVVLVVYLLILLAIGLWGGRESGTVAGYFVAGKKLPSWVIAFSSNSMVLLFKKRPVWSRR